jgi:tetratricopeptide (TPR) repeat protein
LRFRHALLRDTAYASLARADRATLHLDFAGWLAARPPEALPGIAEVIARHYAAAIEAAPALATAVGGRDRAEIGAVAAEWFERASEVAAGVAAWESAYVLAQRSLELTAEDEPLPRARRLERLAQAAEHSAGAAEAEAHARDALDLYRASANRDGISSAALMLGRLLYSQTRFAEAESLADELLSEVGEARDAPTARLLVMRAHAALGGRDAYEPAGSDAELALEVAREVEDAELELTALDLMTQVRAERGDSDPGWAELEQAARRTRAWPTVVRALRARAADHIDDDFVAVPPLLAPAAALAEAHGLVEQAAWCDYVLAETGLGAGHWDEALESGLRAIAVGEERGFSRVVYRDWFVLLPMAHARGLEDLLRRARLSFPAFGEPGPSDSAFARVAVTAAQLRLAASGLEPPFVPDVEWALPSFDLDHGGPSWLAATETVVESWLAAGEIDGAETALDRMRTRLELSPTTRLASAVEALLRARLHRVQGRSGEAAAEARRTLDLLGEGGPWWRAKAIRTLDDVGAADDRLLAVAASLESQLGIAQASAPWRTPEPSL